MYDPTDQQLVLQTIRDVAGQAGMRAIRKARGGTEIWIPLDPKPDHWMSVLLGHRAAEEISRRLTVINADGKRTCNMRCYVSLGVSRIQELKAQIAAEICDALLSGMSTRDVAFKVRVAEKDVHRHRMYLIADKHLDPAPVLRAKKLPAPANTKSHADDAALLHEIKASVADEGLLKGHSNRKVAVAAQASISYVRLRRKLLLVSGRLQVGRISAEEA